MMNCQLQSIPIMAKPNSSLAKLIQIPNRIRRMFKRRFNYLINLLSEIATEKTKPKTLCSIVEPAKGMAFKPGDTVRVKSREDIKRTLNRWNQLKGCAFMEEMWEYCGTKHLVFKQVKRFLDERDYRMKKCQKIMILENLLCNGTKDFGRCDRSCFFFWREEWLEKVVD